MRATARRFPGSISRRRHAHSGAIACTVEGTSAGWSLTHMTDGCCGPDDTRISPVHSPAAVADNAHTALMTLEVSRDWKNAGFYFYFNDPDAPGASASRPQRLQLSSSDSATTLPWPLCLATALPSRPTCFGRRCRRQRRAASRRRASCNSLAVRRR